MAKNFINRTYIEGYIYDHSLEKKVSGPNSKNPGTEFIMGTINVATDDAGVNVVPIHYTYVTATTSTGKPSASYNTLLGVINGEHKTVIADGKENAAKVRIDSAIALNEFYTDRNGETTLVSAKRNEGGFIHVEPFFAKAKEEERNTFEADMLITNVRRVEANEEQNQPEKVIVKGCIFDFRKTLLPVEFTALDPNAMDYFEGLEASDKNPTFTKVWGSQVSTTIVREIVEESAFGNNKVRTVSNTRKDFVLTGANREPYAWDDESTLTAAEVSEAIAARETYLATLKQRQEEYKASKNAPAPTPKNTSFTF